MTATQLIEVVGKTGTIKIEDMSFVVDILDARINYGSANYLIQPVCGSGSKWVASHRVKIVEEN